MKLRPVSELPDTDELVIGWCTTRKTRAGVVEPCPISYAASILKRDLAREPDMPPHLQTGIDVFVLFSDLLTYFENPHVGDGCGDAALAIGEDAFRAGYDAGVKQCGKAYAQALSVPRLKFDDPAEAKERAWSEYDPPEHIKDLS